MMLEYRVPVYRNAPGISEADFGLFVKKNCHKNPLKIINSCSRVTISCLKYLLFSALINNCLNKVEVIVSFVASYFCNNFYFSTQQ